MFKKGEVGFHECPSREPVGDLDRPEPLREYLLLQLKVRAMRDMLVRSRIFNYLAAATPA